MKKFEEQSVNLAAGNDFDEFIAIQKRQSMSISHVARDGRMENIKTLIMSCIGI